ncbi:MAG: alpha-ketoglutarate-dependent dioxygenase AlkB [Bacteroidetes bacterium]|nr:alpha-ketoglutarate-dependent dioxygenase AlkB [Bacteroidota bacterium]
MDLFNQVNTDPKPILPFDGNVIYCADFLNNHDANMYFAELMEDIHWQNDRAVIYGKTITTKRKVAWYGDGPFEYTYSKTTKRALPWTKSLSELKNFTEKFSGESFNSCLLNLYQDGSEGMSWHSDAEKDLIRDGTIASISLGAKRKFSFKHKLTKEIISIELSHGSLLLMKDKTQTHWLHQLPISNKVKESRINLTFRTIKTLNN